MKAWKPTTNNALLAIRGIEHYIKSIYFSFCNYFVTTLNVEGNLAVIYPEECLVSFSATTVLAESNMAK